MKRNMRLASYLLLSTAICLPSIGSASFAQDQADSSGAIEEVIVTATKRSERMLDVPISMSAFSGESIDQTGIRELKEMAEFIPNLMISQENDFRSQVTIRGVGAHSRNIGFDTRVGVYVDGVYMGQSPSLNQELLDLERVEVLRGPQGMLFGKNTVAGAISLITKKPGNEFEGEVSASIGNYGYREFKGFVNIPMGDKVAAKFAVSKTDRGGHIENIVTGNMLNERDVLAYRAQLRIQASDQFEINVSFDGLNSEGLILVGEPLTDLTAAQPDTFTNGANGVVAFNIDPWDKRDIFGGHVDLNYEMENGHTIKSITGYRKTDATYGNATDYAVYDFLSIDYVDNYKQFSEELQFISPSDGALTYMVGLYYYNQTSDTQRDAILGVDYIDVFVAPLYAMGAFMPALDPAWGLDPALVAMLLGFGPPGSKIFNSGTVKTESYAAYFNGAYQVSDRLKLGFGARYSIEDKDVDWLLDGRNSGIFFIGSTGDPANPSPLIADRRDKFFSPAISLTYAVGDNANVYVKYSAGYKSGGFNLDYINDNELAANPDQSFDKETVDSYEAGFKGSFLDQSLVVNAAVFMANYDDYQVNQFVDLGGGRTSIRITNAAKVKTKGIELDFTLRATESLTFSGSMGLLNAKFDSFPGGGVGGTDATGNRLVNAPKLNLAFGAQYYKNVPGLNSALLLRADVTHSGGYYTTADNVKEVGYNSAYPGTIPFGWLPERTLLHGRIGLISNNETWEIYIWGRNLTDQVDPVDGFRDFFGTIVELPSIGRTFGGEVIWNF